MKKYILYLILIRFINADAFAQKNSFSFSYTPSITKLDIKNFPSSGNLVNWHKYYKSKKNDLPAYGFSAGISYKRMFKKINLGVSLIYTELSQISGLYYQAYGISVYSKNYGGTNYEMTYKGVEFPIIFEYFLVKKRSFDVFINSGLSLNVMEEFEIQNYFVNGLSGEYEKGGDTERIGGIQNSKVFWYRIFNAPLSMVRIATWIGFNLEYNLANNFTLSVIPVVKYYSNTLKQANNNDSLDADAFLFGTQLNLNLKF